MKKIVLLALLFVLHYSCIVEPSCIFECLMKNDSDHIVTVEINRENYDNRFGPTVTLLPEESYSWSVVMDSPFLSPISMWSDGSVKITFDDTYTVEYKWIDRNERNPIDGYNYETIQTSQKKTITYYRSTYTITEQDYLNAYNASQP